MCPIVTKNTNIGFLKTKELKSGATSLFDVQGWMFDVLSVRCLSFHWMLNVRCSMLDVPLKRVTGESYVLDVIFQMLSFGRIR